MVREFLKLTKDMLEEMVEQFIRNQVRDFVGEYNVALFFWHL